MIEGRDVPNATVMLIENAERFGLAHSINCVAGRARRAQVYCILLSEDKSPRHGEAERAGKNGNGFEVAKPIGTNAGRAICSARRRADCRRFSLGT